MREIDIKNCTHYFYDIIYINNIVPKNIKTDAKSYKNLLIYYMGNVTRNSVKPLYIIFNEVNRCIEEHNGSKYQKYFNLVEL